MAKVKTATQRITAFLKEKGFDATAIKDAFDELDGADADLDKLAETLDKNKQWVDWYQQITPAMQEIIGERDVLKQQVARLQQAGLTFGEAQETVQQAAHQAAAASDFDPKKFESSIVAATNATIKDAARFGLRHLKKFNEELDYDGVEKVMNEKRVPFEVAYGLYVQPREDELRKKEMEDKIRLGVQEGIQAEMSKQGVRRTRKRTDDIDPAPLDKPAPTDQALKEAWLKDMEENTTH